MIRLDVLSDFFNLIEIFFAEAIDESTANGFNQYEIIGMGNPVAVINSH